MIENQNIICISNTTWHGPYTKSTVQLLSRLSMKNKILFIEYPFTLKDVFTTITRKQNAPVLKMLGFKKRLVKEILDNGSFIYRLNVPPVLPFDFTPEWLFKILNKISVKIYKRSVKRAIGKLKIKDPIVVTAFNPFYGLPLVGEFDEKLNVYYCYDATDTRKHGNRAYAIEKSYCEKADGIIVTSDHLQTIRKPYNDNCLVVKNGVEFDLFNSFAVKKIKKNGSVKIGYVGSLDDRFDIETVVNLIKNKPEWLFEFTGDIRNKAAFSTLRGLANVRFHPAVKSWEVPRVMSELDAGIIPYLKDESNRNIYPLKINEYLAMGIPVIMTDFASFPEFDGLISVEGDADTFLKAVENEVFSDSENKRALRVEAARANSWEERTLRFSESIEELIMKKKSKKFNGQSNI